MKSLGWFYSFPPWSAGTARMASARGCWASLTYERQSRSADSLLRSSSCCSKSDIRLKRTVMVAVSVFCPSVGWELSSAKYLTQLSRTTGRLTVNVSSTRGLFPVEGATVRVFFGPYENYELVGEAQTDESGKAVFRLETPSAELSKTPDSVQKRSHTS